MTTALEVLYAIPVDGEREGRIGQMVASFGGTQSYREIPQADDVSKAVCLTYEFPDRQSAQSAAEALRRVREHVQECLRQLRLVALDLELVFAVGVLEADLALQVQAPR